MSRSTEGTAQSVAPRAHDPHDDVVVVPVEGFDDFYRREFRAVSGLAAVLCGSLAVAEDIAQEAFIAAFRRWDYVQTLDRPESWVRRIVANRSVSRGRRLITEAKALLRLQQERVSDTTDVDALADPVWAMVRQLPRRQRQAIALVYVDGRTLAETAEVLECSVNTIKTHLQRARNTLASQLIQNPEADHDTE